MVAQRGETGVWLVVCSNFVGDMSLTEVDGEGGPVDESGIP
jgi:hypothetical protein